MAAFAKSWRRESRRTGRRLAGPARSVSTTRGAAERAVSGSNFSGRFNGWCNCCELKNLASTARPRGVVPANSWCWRHAMRYPRCTLGVNSLRWAAS